MKPHVAALLFLSLGGVGFDAIAEEDKSDKQLPTAKEVVEYVRENWNGHYSHTFARFVASSGEMAELRAISDVACSYYYVAADCTFKVTARFDGQAEQQVELSDTFDRDDQGRLESVIVLDHPHRR